MAYQRLGKTQEARENLDMAHAQIDKMPLGREDVKAWKALLSEADGLIGTRPSN